MDAVGIAILVRCPWDYRTCKIAALRGHLSIVKWARDNRCPEDDSENEDD